MYYYRLGTKASLVVWSLPPPLFAASLSLQCPIQSQDMFSLIISIPLCLFSTKPRFNKKIKSYLHYFNIFSWPWVSLIALKKYLNCCPQDQSKKQSFNLFNRLLSIIEMNISLVKQNLIFNIFIKNNSSTFS